MGQHMQMSWAEAELGMHMVWEDVWLELWGEGKR